MLDRTGASSLRVSIVDDELNIRKSLAMSIESDGHEVVAVSNAQDAIDQVARGSFDLAFLDLRLGPTLGLDLIPDLLAQSPWMRIVIITAHGSIDTPWKPCGAVRRITSPSHLRPHRSGWSSNG